MSDNGLKALPDSGARMQFSGGAVREPSTGKGRYDLVPAYPIRRLAQHYEHGARKYTTDLSIPISQLRSELVNKCTCANRTAILEGSITPKENADLAMNKVSENSIRSTQNDNEKTPEDGLPQIDLVKEREIALTKHYAKIARGEISSKEQGRSQDSTSLSTTNQTCSSNKEESVESAKDHLGQDGSISITTTPQVKSADSCVESATRESDFLATISKALNEHVHTCFVYQFQVTDNGDGTVRLYRTGDRNWEKGIPLGRFLDSAERHIGMLKDNDRTEDHLAAVMWNIAGYLWTEREILEGRLPQSLWNVPWGGSLTGEKPMKSEG